MAGRVVDYHEDHRALILAGLRDVDRRELYMLTRLRPSDAFDMSAANSLRMWSGFDDDGLLCVFGINRRSALSDVGVPWLIGVDRIETSFRTFARHSRQYADLFSRAFPKMENFVLAENRATVRWLRWLGFDMHQPEPMGFSGAPFIRFTKGF